MEAPVSNIVPHFLRDIKIVDLLFCVFVAVDPLAGLRSGFESGGVGDGASGAVNYPIQVPDPV